MKAELKTKRYVTCPNGCAHEMTVEHLLGEGPCATTKDYPRRRAGPWFCDDCGQGWDLEYDADSVDLTPTKGGREKMIRDWCILELPPQTEPVRFKVRGMRFEQAIEEDNRRYFYEEHTCPTNWLRDVKEIAIGAETDPHGLWKLVAIYDADAEETADAALLGPASDDRGKDD